MWLYYFTILQCFSKIMKTGTLGLHSTFSRMCSNTTTCLSISIFNFPKYLIKYWLQHIQKMITCAKFESASATIINKQICSMVPEKSPKNQILVVQNYEVAFQYFNIVLEIWYVLLHNLQCTILNMMSPSFQTFVGAEQWTPTRSWPEVYVYQSQGVMILKGCCAAMA